MKNLKKWRKTVSDINYDVSLELSTLAAKDEITIEDKNTMCGYIDINYMLLESLKLIVENEKQEAEGQE